MNKKAEQLKLNYKKFENIWWEKVGCRLNQDLSDNGQFDEFPLLVWEENFSDVLPKDTNGLWDENTEVIIPNLELLMHC